MKRAVKYIMMISGIVSLSLSCLFSIPVYADTRTSVKGSYTLSRYTVYQSRDFEEYLSAINLSFGFTNMEAFIWNNNQGNTDIDESVPAFVVATTDYYSNSYDIPRNRRCIEISNLSNIYVNNQASNDAFDQVLLFLLGIATSNPLSGTTVDYGILYGLGYRVTSYTTSTYGNNNSTCYLYLLHKMKGLDEIDFEGSATIHGTLGNELIYGTQESWLTYEYLRFDINTFSLVKNNDQTPISFTDNNYMKVNILTIPNSIDLTGYAIYEINDFVLERADTDLVGYATGKNPYITFMKDTTANLIINEYRQSYSPNNVWYLYSGAGSDLTSINQHLVTIEDLLSDLQVQEINNIYQDITNEYDIDIDLELNTLITDLTDDLNDIDTTDPNYQIPTNDLEKITSFRLIFTNLINTMNSAGVGLLYFVPLILLIIGAII